MRWAKADRGNERRTMQLRLRFFAPAFMSGPHPPEMHMPLRLSPVRREVRHWFRATREKP